MSTKSINIVTRLTDENLKLTEITLRMIAIMEPMICEMGCKCKGCTVVAEAKALLNELNQ